MPFHAEMPTSPVIVSRARAPLQPSLVAGRDQHGGDRDAARGNRRLRPASRQSRRRAARFPQRPAGRRGARASGRRTRPARIASPIAARPNTTASASSSDAPSARSTSMRRDSRARSNRMVSCGSQARRAAGRDRQRRRPSPRRRRSNGRPSRPRVVTATRLRALAHLDLDVEAVAAGDAAGGVDDHRLRASRVTPGKRTRSEPSSCNAGAAGDAVRRHDGKRDAAGGAVGGEGFGAWQHRRLHVAQAVTNRHRALSAASSMPARRWHRPPRRDPSRRNFAELAGEVEILLDQHDRHLAEPAQIGDGAADVLDDRGLDAFGRLVEQQQLAAASPARGRSRAAAAGRRRGRRRAGRSMSLAAPETARTRRRACALVARQRREAGLEVLLHRQQRKDLAALRHDGDAAAGALGGAQPA